MLHLCSSVLPWPGVESGKPTHFTVHTKGAGKAPVDVQFTGTEKGDAVQDFDIIDNYDYSHTVKYTPVQQVSESAEALGLDAVKGPLRLGSPVLVLRGLRECTSM